MDPPLLELREVMRRLRAECPWKREQTHRSLVRYLVEELHETVDAVETGTADDLREELGDLLLQVYFHAAIAEEAGEFTVDDVAAGIVAKLRRRNPHVFGDAGEQAGAAEVNELWESVKAAEKPRADVTDGLAPSLPTLLYADKVLARLARAGRPAPDAEEQPVLLLVPSPLLGPATWRPVAWWLSGAGHRVDVVDHGGARTPGAVVDAVVDAAAGRPVVLVVHSNAGLYAPHLATPLDVRATVYVDAALAGPGPETALAPPALRAHLADLADADGVLPVWTRWWPSVDALLPDAATRAAVEAEQVRLPLAYVDGRLPVPAGWTAAPAAYLAFGDTYAEELAAAREAGWPVAVLDGGHLHQLVDPAAVGAAVADLMARVEPGSADGRGAEFGRRLLALVAQARAVGVDPDQALRDAVRRLLHDDRASGRAASAPGGIGSGQ